MAAVSMFYWMMLARVTLDVPELNSCILYASTLSTALRIHFSIKPLVLLILEPILGPAVGDQLSFKQVVKVPGCMPGNCNQ